MASKNLVADVFNELKKHGITQAKVAEDLKLSRQAVSRWRREGASDQRLDQICNRYNVEIDTRVRMKDER